MFDERKILFVGLEHVVLICVYMELQRRDGSQSDSELFIKKYCICVFFDKWIFIFFKTLPKQCTVWYF